MAGGKLQQAWFRGRHQGSDDRWPVQETMLVGVCEQMESPAQAQLLEDRRQTVPNGRLADMKSLRNLPVAQAFAYQRNDLAIAALQRRRFSQGPSVIILSRPIPVRQHVGHHRALEPDFAAMNLGDGLEEHLRGVVFEHHSHGAMMKDS